jgi:MerR family transcriptional regulator, light-induced transcriptional regulator
LVYIRNKKVKGIQYAYLVQSKWDQESNTSRQIIIKYLGRTSEITLDYISAYGPSQKERERLIGILQKEMFNLL